MSRIFAILLAVWPFTVGIASVRKVVPESLYLAHENSTKSLMFSYSHLPNVSKFEIMHPHDAVNKEKKTQVFSGVLVSDLLKQLGQPIGPKDSVTVVAKNGYAVELPFELFDKSSAAIAPSVDGRVMKLEEGSPNLIYTKIGPELSLLNKPELWVWWVAALFVGEPKPALEMNRKSADLGSCKGLGPRMISYPRGYRASSLPKDKVVEISGCTLGALAKLQPEQRVSAEISTLTGEKKTFAVRASEIEIIHGVEGKTLAPALGGPVQICIKQMKHDCVYFAAALSFENLK